MLVTATINDQVNLEASVNGGLDQLVDNKEWQSRTSLVSFRSLDRFEHRPCLQLAMEKEALVNV